jgi:dTDP-4-dehydrorhamnose 3,5-epimerase
VVGKGKNFIKTMYELAQKGVEPKVVNDQLGRLTFAKDLAKAIHYLVSTEQEYGTYNMTNDGKVVSWADIAKLVYKSVGIDPKKVTGVSTQEYFDGKEFIALRPLKSELDLGKIKSTGFKPRDWQEAFDEYIEELKGGY